MKFQPQKIIISPEVKNAPMVKTILHNCPTASIKYTTIDHEPACLHQKNVLLLTQNKGNFYKPCPGTISYLCCLYKILNIGVNCPLSCSYCILQAYLEHSIPTVHVNIEKMIEELDGRFDQYPSRVFRIGTGEFTDSLAFDHLTEFSKMLIPYFALKDNAFLELKTKTDIIDNLGNLDHRQKTVVSWSLNASRIVREEEHNAPSVDRRLLAAKKCQDWGYKLAFHFDPIIFFPGWEIEYQDVIDELFSMVNPSRVVWISLGCFRYIPKLKPIIQEKFSESRIIYEEFIRGLDGKMRYLEVIREQMYSQLISRIRKHAPNVFLYFCMESPKIWQKCLGFCPANNGELQSLLNEQCLKGS